MAVCVRLAVSLFMLAADFSRKGSASAAGAKGEGVALGIIHSISTDSE